MFKNISINQIAIILALSLAGLNVAVFVTLSIYEGRSMSITFWISLILISIICAYTIVKFFFEKFIFRKIKLIYKIINDSKRSVSSDSNFGLNSKSIERVNDEVIAWAQKKESEIQYLNQIENYRRDFLGNISHELKTPIFTIQGYLHTLIDGGIYDENINKRYLERAISNVERLENIVDDLEMINKLESGKLVLDIVEFDIKDLVEEVFGDLYMLAEEKNINLKLKEGASKGFLVMGDRENIRQVFNNLITNAIKYSLNNGTTKVAFYDMDDKVLIEVSDDGMGISEENLKHVFDRFYRVDKSRNRKIGGSGLGLSIVKHIIEAHEQTITVRSTLNEGSTFGFTLKKA